MSLQNENIAKQHIANEVSEPRQSPPLELSCFVNSKTALTEDEALFYVPLRKIQKQASKHKTLYQRNDEALWILTPNPISEMLKYESQSKPNPKPPKLSLRVEQR